MIFFNNTFIFNIKNKNYDLYNLLNNSISEKMQRKLYFLLFILLLIPKFLCTTIDKNKTTCTYLADCDQCVRCGNDTKNFSNCNFTNLFCKSNTSQLMFFPQLFDKYIYNYRSNRNIRNYCGKQELFFNFKQNTIDLKFDKKVIDYLINDSLHCSYGTINHFISYPEDYEITFELINSSDYKFNFDIIFRYRSEKKSGIDFFSDNSLRDNKKKYILTKTNHFMILIDFHKNIKPVNEILQIKIKCVSKYVLPFSRKVYLKFLFQLVSIPFIVFLLFLGIISVCVRNRIRRNRNNLRRLIQRENFILDLFTNPREQLEIENKIKIENLFQTTMVPKEFQQKDLVNDCASCIICLQNFEDKKSIVCTTSCNHMFHYDCLKAWADSKAMSFKCPICKKNLLENENRGEVRVVENSERANINLSNSQIGLGNHSNSDLNLGTINNN